MKPWKKKNMKNQSKLKEKVSGNKRLRLRSNLINSLNCTMASVCRWKGKWKIKKKKKRRRRKESEYETRISFAILAAVVWLTSIGSIESISEARGGSWLTAGWSVIIDTNSFGRSANYIWLDRRPLLVRSLLVPGRRNFCWLNERTNKQGALFPLFTLAFRASFNPPTTISV